MVIEHLLNIFVHVIAGTLGLVLGLIILSRAKGTELHKRLGQWFCYLCLAVCVSAALGLMFFRFLPVFAILDLLVFYQLVSGWRSAYTKHKGPAMVDLLFTLIVSVVFSFLLVVVLRSNYGSPVIVYATMTTLILILIYDLLKWFFPRRVFGTLWRYEHIYKLISCVFGMLSALMGNVVRMGQPWSQIAPSVLGMLVILYFFYRLTLELRSTSGVTARRAYD
jgi:uncharacterized membrane protein